MLLGKTQLLLGFDVIYSANLPVPHWRSDKQSPPPALLLLERKCLVMAGQKNIGQQLLLRI